MDVVELREVAVEEGAAEEVQVVLPGHVGRVLKGRDELARCGGVGVRVDGDAVVEELLQERADVEGGCAGVGQREQFSGGGAAADAAGAVRGPVQEREAVRVVRERGEVADLALAWRRCGGARLSA